VEARRITSKIPKSESAAIYTFCDAFEDSCKNFVCGLDVEMPTKALEISQGAVSSGWV